MSEEKAPVKSQGKLALLRIRGDIDMTEEVRSTLHMLNLHHKNWCVIVESSQTLQGMLKKVKDYITWGEVSEDTVKSLFAERGEEYTGRLEDKQGKIKYNKFVEHGNKKYQRYFRLAPPLGGFAQKGIKRTFREGGVLGYRGDAINELIKKMI